MIDEVKMMGGKVGEEQELDCSCSIVNFIFKVSPWIGMIVL